MNQKVEQALIDYSNDVWDRAMKAGALAEQERIIKVLKKKLFNTVYNDGEYPAVVNQQHFAGDIIALIKGEK